MYQSFSKRQMLAMTWWNRPGLHKFEGIICDGAIRSGKTLSMVTGFFLWSMASFHGCAFALCGRTVGALRRNIVSNLHGWLGDTVEIRENRSENKLTVTDGRGRRNTYYLFGGQDESSYKLIQGITLAGVLLDEAALMPRSFVEQACARCSVTGSKQDGIPGPETLGNTVTVSANKNATHPVVEFVQKRLVALGYTEVGAADGVAGPKFTQAVQAFQKDNGCVADGEITARNKTWRKLLGME